MGKKNENCAKRSAKQGEVPGLALSRWDIKPGRRQPYPSLHIPHLANRVLWVATLDRLRHGAYRLTLDGDSFRAPRPLPESPKNTHS